MKRTFTLLMLLLGATTGLMAQAENRDALNYLQKNFAAFQLEATDVDDLKVTDNYLSPGGTRHVYLIQRVHQLPVLNAQASLHFRGDKLVHRTSDLATGLAEVPSPAPAFSAQTAVGKAANAVAAAFGTPTAIGTDATGELRFDWPEVSPKAIKASTGYFKTDEGLRLAYRVLIDRQVASSDYWHVVVDAISGEVLDQHNYVLKCNFGTPKHQHNYNNACANTTPAALPVSERMLEKTFSIVEQSRYNVFPFGEESPLHGERVMQVSPAHPVASPFGWHDVNGVVGAEFTTTRGNNTFSYPDTDGNNEVDTDVVADGGDSLVFDFPFAEDVPADSVLQAALAQTFYYTNKLHDWLFQVGFNEASGNFQRRNYSGEGQGGDEVRVEAQDGSGTNNANFATPPDGSSGRMQMFLWTGSNSAMQVTEPAPISGPYRTGTALFGADITSDPLTGQVAITDPALACTELINGGELTGKIALVTRGECNFSLKVFNAQEAGAIAVIICNDARVGEERGGIINMSNGNPELTITIPAVFVTFETCANLRTTVASGDSVSVTFRAPPPRDGDFDNGIVAHELGHGVSNRLVGGPGNTNCLGNDEQMGEGWSDFFSLAASPKTIIDNPDGTEPRGIGNYATRNTINGGGIRNRPYSTDFAVNEQTYYNVIISGTAPHPLGEIWAATLWDLYWAMVNQDGFDDDLIDGTGGNNKAVQLVVEGLKYTACRPGLVDGRDGILVADEIINGGANSCLIWEVFARRGLGFSADQGSSNSRSDNRQAFDTSPYCIGGIELTKTSDVGNIDAGGGVEISLLAESFREGVSGKVVITDEIPDGMTFEPTSVRGTTDFVLNGSTLTFNLGDMEFEDSRTIVYSVTTDRNRFSVESYFDGAEQGDDNWLIGTLNEDVGIVPVFWEQADTTPYEGDFTWYIVNAGTEQDQFLQTADALPVTGANPALRFFTKYQTEAAWDAGIVEISTNGTTWDRVADKFLRGEYRGIVAPSSPSVLSNVLSFWGNNGDFEDIVIDLSDYAGEDIFIRWRFVSDAADRARGWWVDNIQLLDIVSYDAPATLTSDAGDNVMAMIGNLGVIATGFPVSANDPTLGQTEVKVFPNPASDLVTVEVVAERAGSATIQLLSIDGRVLHTELLGLVAGGGRTTIGTQQLPAGMYIVQVTGANRVSTTKLTVN
jgi:hypothetical protein